MRFWVCVAGMALFAVGCQQSALVSSSAEGPPHGGYLITLPDGKGYAELVNKAASQPAGARRPSSTITVYFLQSDLKTPMSPAPTNVSLGIEGSAGTQNVALSHADEATFSSKPGQYGGGQELSGTLSATVGGTSITTPFMIR